MEFKRLANDTIQLSRLDAFLLDLLREVPAAAEPGDHRAARERLYSKPIDDAQAELLNEWKKYVQPELRHLFESAVATVKEDLARVEKERGTAGQVYCLHIPLPHAEPWLSALNQARLALAARNNFTEEDMNRPVSMTLESPRELALFQVHFYGFLQELLVREVSPG